MSRTQEQTIKKSASIMGITVEEYKARAEKSEKRCAGCRVWKQKSEFPRDNSRKDGIGLHCKLCRSTMGILKRQKARAAAPPAPPRVKKKRPSRAKVKPVVVVDVQPDEMAEFVPTRAERVAKVAGGIAEFKAYIEWRKSAKHLTDVPEVGCLDRLEVVEASNDYE